MSWAEVKKINSNLCEPLNYASYVADIAYYGANSAILHPYYEALWQDFFMKSTALYCQRNAHDTVYNRLTDADLDRIWTEKKDLGELLNAFFKVQLFPEGNVEKVIAGMTQNSYNLLPDKFRRAYQRQVEIFLHTSTGVGNWFNESFALKNQILASKASWTDLLDSVDCMNAVSSSEAAIVAVVTSNYATDLLVKHTHALTFITSNIARLESELLWYAVSKNTTVLAAIYSNSSSMTALANSNLIMKSILRDATAMAYLIGNASAIKIAFDTANSRNIITQTITEVSRSTDALTKIKSELSSINSQLPSVVGGSFPMESMTAASTQITASLNVLNPIITAATAVENLIRSLINNSTSMREMANSAPTMQILFANALATKIIVENTNAVYYISSSTGAMDALSKSDIAMTEFAKNAYAMQQFSANALPFSYILKSNYRHLFFDQLDFRKRVNNNRNSLLSSTYFTSEICTFSQVPFSHGSGHGFLKLPNQTGKIYICTNINVTTGYIGAPMVFATVDIYDYAKDYLIQAGIRMGVASGQSNDYRITQFPSIAPIYDDVSITGNNYDRLLFVMTYTKYTAKENL